ncbi:MAG: PDR/VanB family oxidoreductase [Pseudomonadota bacterium]
MSRELIQVRVAKKTLEAINICVFELVEWHGQPLPAFSAGAHIDVHGPTGVLRQYSLCNDPAETHRYQIAVLRTSESRGGSRAMHDRLEEGDVISIGAPRNLFALEEGARRSILLAGGIGITPILAMAERLHSLGADFELHYCARSLGHAAFYSRLARSAFAGRIVFHFDDDLSQRATRLAALLAAPDGGSHLYVCGPKGFLQFIASTAKQGGWADSHVHAESFGAGTAPVLGDRVFEIHIASSGERYTVPPDRSVASVLLDNGIEIPLSCEQGVCGTCLTGVIDGVPEHRDHYLTNAEHEANDQFTPCCSRARSDCLTLDL